MRSKKTEREEVHPVPPEHNVKCYICSKDDSYKKMTYDSKRKKYICDKCLDKDMKGVSYDPEIAAKILREHNDIL